MTRPSNLATRALAAPARATLALATLALTACSTDTGPRPASVAAAPARAAMGLERIMGQDARALTGLLGPAALDVREGKARKLQWRGPACVLDAYLYPPATGAGEATVTWIDARTGTGADTDRTACLTALATPAGAVARR